jgi:hypothetical protein
LTITTATKDWRLRQWRIDNCDNNEGSTHPPPPTSTTHLHYKIGLRRIDQQSRQRRIDDRNNNKWSTMTTIEDQ